MNDKMISMTQTEKRYSKNIGKLFWCGERTYSLNTGQYEYYFNLVMISGIQKDKYSKKYQYSVDVISSPYKDKVSYKLDCSWFKILFGNINQYGNGYLPASTGDLEKDVAQIPKAC